MTRKNNTSSYTEIYLAFYVYQLDTSISCCSYNGIESKLLDLWCGPFTHVQICHTDDIANEDGILNTFISRPSKEVKHVRCKLTRPGYVFTKIRLTKKQNDILMTTINHIKSHPTKFSYMLCTGMTTANDVNDDSKNWYCSILTAYLLKRCGILEEDVNININVTELFYIIRNLDTSDDCKINPFTKKALVTKSADEIFTSFTGKEILENSV
ncbi:MAG: hypothetical protein AABY22_32395 [Nanoarchaeota archaeon]